MQTIAGNLCLQRVIAEGLDAPPPLCIDLDGTLLRTDTLWETLLALLKTHPLKIFLIPVWLLQGRARLKQRLAQNVRLDCNLLPYTDELLEFLKREHASGRELVLVSGCDGTLGNQIAEHLGFFRQVITSDGQTNVKGNTKARILNERFGPEGFDYAGNEHADIPVWAAARKRLVANAPPRLIRRMAKHPKPVHLFAPRRSPLPALIKALRCHQWSKNLLVFVPLVLGHAYFDWEAVTGAAVLFVAWCLVASSNYVANDLLDLEADRSHPSKKLRPFATGDLPLWSGLPLAPALMFAGLLLATTVSYNCAATLVLYAGFATAYSFHLKRRPLVDVFTLAFLFTIRVIGGGLATGRPVTMWLLAFSGFLFLGLAFLKRCSELVRIRKLGRQHLGSRGYGVVDLPMLQMFGVTSAFVAILVFGLYLNSSAVDSHYEWPAPLWAIGPLLLLWLCRLWLATSRGEMEDDPIVYSFRDHISWLLGALVLCSFIIATAGKVI